MKEVVILLIGIYLFMTLGVCSTLFKKRAGKITMIFAWLFPIMGYCLGNMIVFEELKKNKLSLIKKMRVFFRVQKFVFRYTPDYVDSICSMLGEVEFEKKHKISEEKYQFKKVLNLESIFGFEAVADDRIKLMRVVNGFKCY